DVFAVLTAGTRNGTFSSLSFPPNQVTMLMSNTPTSVIVRVTDVVPPGTTLVLAAEIAAGSELKLCWPLDPNASYEVEFTPSLSPANWKALSGEVTAAGNTACVTEPVASSSRFYRVRIVR